EPEEIRHHPLKSLRNLLLSQSYPHFNPRREREKRREISRLFWFFLFCFADWVRCIASPPAGEGGADGNRSLLALSMNVPQYLVPARGGARRCEISACPCADSQSFYAPSLGSFATPSGPPRFTGVGEGIGLADGGLVDLRGRSVVLGSLFPRPQLVQLCLSLGMALVDLGRLFEGGPGLLAGTGVAERKTEIVVVVGPERRIFDC